MRTSLIIFGKDRTLQLKSLLLSIKTNTDIPEDAINVIYKNVDKNISFEPLKEEFNCNFIEQGDFLQDIKDIVKNSDSEYFQFMVDDLIVKDKISLAEIEDFMDKHPDVDSFCLRMGKNIKCGKQPDFEEHPGDILTWNTAKDLGKHWNYFWDVSSSSFRRQIVEQYLAKCRHDKERFPNPFEDHFYSCMPTTNPRPSVVVNLVNSIRFCCQKKSHKIACFAKSKCFTQGVNLVADIKGDDREQQFDPVYLHKQMVDGYVIDFKSLKDVFPEEPNAGHTYFKLIKEEEIVERFD